MTSQKQRSKRLATQPRARRESDAVLALFALFLNLLAAFVPPPAMAAFNGSDSALLCTSGGDSGNGETPTTPAGHHHCQDCLAQQIGGNANLPEPGPALLTLPCAEPLSSAHSYFVSPSQPATPSQPRAPPTAG